MDWFIDPDRLDFFLSIEVTPGGLFLSQSKYISNLLEQSKMINANGSITPMLSSSTLSASNADPMEKSHQYRNIFGAMQYATITRLDIAFSVNTVSRQLMYNPLDTHQKAVTRILSYLKLTLHMDYSRGNLKT